MPKHIIEKLILMLNDMQTLEYNKNFECKMMLILNFIKELVIQFPNYSKDCLKNLCEQMDNYRVFPLPLGS
jgi:hypothetical protein